MCEEVRAAIARRACRPVDDVVSVGVGGDGLSAPAPAMRTPFFLVVVQTWQPIATSRKKP